MLLGFLRLDMTWLDSGAEKFDYNQIGHMLPWLLRDTGYSCYLGEHRRNEWGPQVSTQHHCQLYIPQIFPNDLGEDIDDIDCGVVGTFMSGYIQLREWLRFFHGMSSCSNWAAATWGPGTYGMVIPWDSPYDHGTIWRKSWDSIIKTIDFTNKS
jgi:hypothetical protein